MSIIKIAGIIILSLLTNVSLAEHEARKRPITGQHGLPIQSPACTQGTTFTDPDGGQHYVFTCYQGSRVEAPLVSPDNKGPTTFYDCGNTKECGPVIIIYGEKAMEQTGNLKDKAEYTCTTDTGSPYWKDYGTRDTSNTETYICSHKK